MMLTARLPTRVHSSCRALGLSHTAKRGLRSTAIIRGAGTGSAESLRKTPLYELHKQNGAQMVDFAGWDMPLRYESATPVASHHHVRNNAGLFDVGHMVQTMFRGPTISQFLERLTPSSLSGTGLGAYHSTLSVLLNPEGGIIDDTVITKHTESSFYVVTNAGRRDRDLPWFEEQLKLWNESEVAKKEGGVTMEVMEGWGLVALQGPKAAEWLQKLTTYDLTKLTFGKSAYISISPPTSSSAAEQHLLHVARGGYTGEDGFEISIPPETSVAVTQLLLSSSSVKGVNVDVQLAGLAARDSLRLEAGMCLYGNDLDETTSPIEAGLTWVIGKERRAVGAGFIGESEVLRQIKEGPRRRRVGFVSEGAPARQGAQIVRLSDSAELGTVTSGIPSPTLGKNVAMGYIDSKTPEGLHKKGSEVGIMVRGKVRKAVVTPMPFVKTGYYRG